ncbi:FtsQ-type POTRA domain-containing protein [Microbacterium gorillae]|uniref:FtsQ-type POTRA domain-containing protein n=1 Tax=Microbacterium gorillae TaxID=1231063 RepID=UPI001E589855|nr:FtsQ-type POTRA domain-containing protein [Microbacterium gorillae]
MTSPDEVDTAVDVQTLDGWAESVDPNATAPIRPLHVEPETVTDVAEEDTADEADTADAAPTGLRDVWRASRARRRTLRREVRRFTVRSRRRRMIWLVSLAAVVLVVAGSFAVAYSPLFAVRTIVVTGTKTLPAQTVEKALHAQVGTPLAAVDASAIKAELVKFPLVETYSVEARPPHELVVRIVERTPIGVIDSAAGYTLVDAAGVALSTTPEQPAGEPLISAGEAGSKAFTAVGLVIRSLPADIRANLATGTATTADDVTAGSYTHLEPAADKGG